MTHDTVKVSKFLSLVLRHRPEEIGLVLDANGWADIDALVERAGAHGMALTRELIAQVVAGSDKQRFALDEGGNRIRANQGHSVDVELGLEPREPPARLFHGTVERNIASIRAEGLRSGDRQHVHLSADAATATKVGQRYGRPVVLQVRSAAMWDSGLTFFCSANGVWLTKAVPPEYIEFPN